MCSHHEQKCRGAISLQLKRQFHPLETEIGGYFLTAYCAVPLHCSCADLDLVLFSSHCDASTSVILVRIGVSGILCEQIYVGPLGSDWGESHYAGRDSRSIPVWPA